MNSEKIEQIIYNSVWNSIENSVLSSVSRAMKFPVKHFFTFFDFTQESAYDSVWTTVYDPAEFYLDTIENFVSSKLEEYEFNKA